MTVRVALTDVPRVHPEAAVSKVGGRWVAVTLDDRTHSFESDQGVSEVAERIIELIDGSRTVSDIVNNLTQEFEVEPGIAERDTLDFIALLVNKHVLVV